MDDDQIDVNIAAGEEASDSESSTEETKAPEEVETPVEESTEDSTEETQAETDEGQKKGAQSRIRQLNAKAKRAEEKAKSLQSQLEELTRPVGDVGQPQFQPQVDVNGEVTLDQVYKTTQSMIDLKIRQSEAINRINNEANQVLSKYSQLNPDSDDFDEDLSNWITETVTELVKANPYTASPKKIVANLMKPYQRAVTKEVGKASENIARQVSQAATRPTSVTTKGGKDYKDKSIAELEQELGVIY